jgi:hypothetical protein
VRLVDRMWAPDFRDRMAVIARAPSPADDDDDDDENED